MIEMAGLLFVVIVLAFALFFAWGWNDEDWG